MALSVLLPMGAARADCPPPEAIETGIEVTYAKPANDPNTDVFRRLPDGRIELLWTDAGDVNRDILEGGVFWSFSQPLTNGVPDGLPLLREADPPFAAGDRPVPGGRWDSRVRILWAPDDIEKVTLTFEWKAMETRDIGGCNLNVLPGTAVESGSRDGTFRQDLLYLPDYGVTIVTAYAFNQKPITRLTPTDIRAVP
ncbi:hypothetical protein [Jannaschia marina]|uniref:hypothetical protein n=1 Tax=Jannaschia marina TaxID=2741674 RepID=UPI0015C6BB58|nr:hypothetical protein [Jannaschia marina]